MTPSVPSEGLPSARWTVTPRQESFVKSSMPSKSSMISSSPSLMAPWTRPSTALPTRASTSGMRAASWLSMPMRPSGAVKSPLRHEASSSPLALTWRSRSKPGATPLGSSRVNERLVTTARRGGPSRSGAWRWWGPGRPGRARRRRRRPGPRRRASGRPGPGAGRGRGGASAGLDGAQPVGDLGRVGAKEARLRPMARASDRMTLLVFSLATER